MDKKTTIPIPAKMAGVHMAKGGATPYLDVDFSTCNLAKRCRTKQIY